MNEPANGRRVLELAAQWRGDPAVDDAFEDHVLETASADADTDPWLE
jgi:hypothetical protein